MACESACQCPDGDRSKSYTYHQSPNAQRRSARLVVPSKELNTEHLVRRFGTRAWQGLTDGSSAQAATCQDLSASQTASQQLGHKKACQ